MSPARTPNSRPTVFALHALGSSRLEYDGVAGLIGAEFDVVALDLPGFGDAGTSSGVTVGDMARGVIRSIKKHGSTRFVLVGHSMGGKVASVVASRILDGSAGLFGLAGVVLLAASPPSPEPMEESRRADMLSWAADGGLDATAARTFVDANVGAPLEADLDVKAVADVQRADREAWIAWLERGSKEDWTAEVGTLDLPALIVAGGSDGDLGEDAQRRLNAPHYPRADIVVLEGAGHLLPLERTRAVAALVTSFWQENAGRARLVPTDFAKTIASSRTSARTRSILAARALADDPDYVPSVLSPAQLDTLRAFADRVVPQTAPNAARDAAARDGGAQDAARPIAVIDLAARVDAQLAAGSGDGWRNAASPPDPDAYRLALDALAGFADLEAGAQDARLAALSDGTFEAPADASAGATPFGSEQLTAWFEDARVDLVRHWLAHPATMERIGYDGFANGGDLLRFQGFQLLAAKEREGWEPAMTTTTQEGLHQ